MLISVIIEIERNVSIKMLMFKLKLAYLFMEYIIVL